MTASDALTFENVWFLIKENSEQIKALKEQMQDTDRKMQDTDRKMRDTDQKMKETDKRVGELTNRFGELAEHLVVPSIKEKFNEMGFSFEQISQDITISDSSGRCLAEVDILLENGDVVIAVEIKAKPLPKDVDAHIGRMEVLRRRADARRDVRKFQGAIAGAIMKDEVRDYAYKSGFYVIEQTGDTVKINIPKDFKPREW